MRERVTPLVAAIIVLYNSRKHLPRLIASLKAQTYPNMKTYFFDNASGDDGVSFINEHLPGAAVIHSAENLGYAAGNNRAAKPAKQAGADFLFFLNPDTELDPDCVREMVALFETEKDTGLAAPVLLYGGERKAEQVIQHFGSTVDFKTRKSTWFYANRRLDEDVPQYMPVDLISGAVTFIKTGIFFELGEFEERYFLYGEEIDLAFRAKEKGIKTMVTSRSRAWHHHDWSAANVVGNRIMYYYKTRNRYLYFRKFKQRKNFLKYLLEDIICFPLKIRWAVKKKDFKLVKFYYMGVIGGILNHTGKAHVCFE